MLDRGNKKWTALMLPEHIEKLQDIFEDEQKIEKPILSYDQLEEMERTIQQAIEFNLKLDIIYWNNHNLHTVEGYIDKIRQSTLFINTSDGTDLLEIKNIVELSVCET